VLHDNKTFLNPCRSGCGKSTLLGIVAGLYEPSAGHVILKQTNKTADVEEGEVQEASADIPFAGKELLRSQVSHMLCAMIFFTNSIQSFGFL
jgi:ABC-type bacteriocin/lantibiotic exporter with double-glycine peptidase domain